MAVDMSKPPVDGGSMGLTDSYTYIQYMARDSLYLG